METREKIPVFILTHKGKTVCICHAKSKGCGKPCPRDTVERDKFRDWEKVMQRNRYGK
nr:MAG TPA: hypothetical protein [Caudoviricetes sp.]